MLSVATILGLNYVFVWPLLNAWNMILFVVCNNPPMDIDIDVFFPEARWLFESPTQFATIRGEVARYLDTNKVPCLHEIAPRIRIDLGTSDQCWRFMPLKTTGYLDERYRTWFPVLMNALDHPAIVSAIISSLDPGTHIPPHRGYFKGYLRYHLAVEVPNDCTNNPAHIVCGGMRHNWESGQGVLFDDMFLHHVTNPSPSQRRTVIYLDVRRRHLPRALQPINDMMYWLINNNPFIQLFIRDQHRQRRR